MESVFHQTVYGSVNSDAYCDFCSHTLILLSIDISSHLFLFVRRALIMPASIEYYGNLRFYVKLCPPSKSNHCNCGHGRRSNRSNSNHFKLQFECNGTQYQCNHNEFSRIGKCFNQRGPAHGQRKSRLSKILSVFLVRFRVVHNTRTSRKWPLQMGSNYQEYDFGQFLLGLHIDGIAGRTSGRNYWRTSCFRSQHAMGQRIDHVHTGRIVHRLQSTGRCQSTAGTDVGYEIRIDIDRCNKKKNCIVQQKISVFHF